MFEGAGHEGWRDGTQTKLKQCLMLRNFGSFVFLGAGFLSISAGAVLGAEQFGGRHQRNVGSVEKHKIFGPGRQQAHWADSAGAGPGLGIGESVSEGVDWWIRTDHQRCCLEGEVGKRTTHEL